MGVKGANNAICVTCFQPFHNRPSRKNIRCERCRVGMKGKPGGTLGDSRGMRIKRSLRCPLCFRGLKVERAKVCKRCWSKIQHMFSISRTRRKESPYNGSRYGQLYTRRARQWGVDIREGDLIRAGGITLEMLAPWRREMLTRECVSQREEDFNDYALAGEIEAKLEEVEDDE